MRRPGRESLTNIPLISQLLEDPHVRLSSRAVDQAWHYSGHLPGSAAGFNPLERQVYYGRRSVLAEWLASPHASARRLNERDLLLTEALFAAHDYLHCWAYLAIQNLAPRLGFGIRPIRPGNVEDFVFCHLLTEAVATVGLDYWYLCTVDLNQVCDIGTRLHHGLSTPFHQRHLREYRKYNFRFEAQHEPFLGDLARFYCTGRFPGFELRALRRSPLILAWLEHELGYGERQRRYIRQWLAYLSGGEVRYPDAKLEIEVSVEGEWKEKLIHEMGALLWQKTKGGKATHFAPLAGSPWTEREPGALDFQFINANRFRSFDRAFAASAGEASSRAFTRQILSRHEFAPLDEETQRLLPGILERGDFIRLKPLLRKLKRLPLGEREPVHLFMLS